MNRWNGLTVNNRHGVVLGVVMAAVLIVCGIQLTDWRWWLISIVWILSTIVFYDDGKHVQH